VEKSQRAKLRYRCKRCGTITEHRRLRRPQARCEKCQRFTNQELVTELPPPARVAPGKPSVAVEHVAEAVKPEAPPAAPAAAPPGEEWPEVLPGEGLMLSPEDWADLYGMPAEAISLALAMPELDISDERCKTQGVRLARFCQRHNIVIPPWLDIVPIASAAVADYGKLLRTAVLKAKEKKEKEKLPEPESPKVPESKVEHSAEASPDIDERIKKAITERR